MQMYGMMGERLGVIGQESESLPSWKRDFLSKPSVSIRKGIAWGTQYAYEDTSTLVLTSPSSRFVDIRFPKTATNPSESTLHPSFWAFSGEAETSFYDASSNQDKAHAVSLLYTAQCRFRHRIDTRGTGILDQGDTCILPNGDCLEFGKMVNPASGNEELYKEYWSSGEVLPGSEEIDDAKQCIVAQVASPANVEGTIIKIGGRIQGITSRRREDGTQVYEVERWFRGPVGKFIEQAKPVSDHLAGQPMDGWYRDVRSSGYLPCAWVCGQERRIGENFEYEGILWNVTELVQ